MQTESQLAAGEEAQHLLPSAQKPSDHDTSFSTVQPTSHGDVALPAHSVSSVVPAGTADHVCPPFPTGFGEGESFNARQCSISDSENLTLNPGMEVRGVLGRIQVNGEKILRQLKAHWILVCFASVVASLVISIPIGWALRLRPFQDAADTGEPGLALHATLISVDPGTGSMTIDWGVNVGLHSCQDYPNATINLYFDQNLLRSSSCESGSPSNNRPSVPVFSMNMTEECPWDYYGDSAYFRTDIAIGSLPGSTVQSYPFDVYYADISMYTEIPNNSTLVPVSITRTGGIAVGYSTILTDLEPGTSVIGNTFKSKLTITRGLVIRLYSVLIVLAIWLVTLAFLATCVAVVFLGRPTSAAVLALPVGTLFAFTQLRSTLPGAPAGFGADIDFVGILPCLTIITFCSVLMILVFLYRNPESWRTSEDKDQEKYPSNSFSSEC